MDYSKGLIYLINMTTLDKLVFQYVPMELSYTREATVSEVQIIGRNEPKWQTGGGKTSMPLELEFYAESENRQDVMRKVEWLTRLTKADGYKRGQPKVKLVWGDMFRDEQWFVKSVKPTFSLFVPAKGMLPQQAKVSMELVRTSDTNTTWEDEAWPFDYEGISDTVDRADPNTIA